MAGQEDVEDAALADFGVTVDEPAGLLDDAVDHRQAEAGALADLLGREERLEDLLDQVRRDAGAGVFHFDDHIFGRREVAVAELPALFRRHVAGADGQLAASRHGVARVDREVDDDLLELADVGAHRPKVAAMIDLELDVAADQPRQQHPEVGQHVGQVQHFRPQRLLARKGQKLAHQRGGAVGVLLDVHDVREGRVGRTMVGQQQVGRHDDGGQHVVEVVRDAAGELAHGLHLLALRHLDLERLLLGQLDGIDDRRFLGAVAAGAVGDGVDVEADVPLLVAGQHGIDRRDVGLPLLGFVERRREGGAVAFMDDRVEPHPPVDRIAVDDRGEQGQERCVGPDDAPALVDAGNRHRRRVEEAGEPDLGCPQVGRGILAQRAVEHDGAARSDRPLAGRADAVHETHRQRFAGHGGEVEIDHRIAGRPRIGPDRADQRHAVAGDDLGERRVARRKARQVDAEPLGERRVDIGDAAFRVGRKEAGRRMVEMVDRLLQIEEEAFLLGTLA